jgi:hypothetical protein
MRDSDNIRQPFPMKSGLQGESITIITADGRSRLEPYPAQEYHEQPRTERRNPTIVGLRSSRRKVFLVCQLDHFVTLPD